MNRITATLTALAATLSISACTDPAEPVAPAPSAAETDAVVTVNGQPITQDQLDVYARRRGGQATPDDMIDDLISIELLAQAALAQGLDRRPQTAGELASQRATTLAQAAVRARLDDVAITDEAVEAEYHRFISEDIGEQLSASHILVEDEALASSLIERLDGGADFGDLAREHSTDTSATEGGSLGWFDSSAMVRPFSDAAAGLEIGAYTPDPVETQFGWHVIRLDGRRATTPPAFDDIREEIRGYLQSQAIEAWVNELRGEATIERPE